MIENPKKSRIEIKLKESRQIFDNRDPSPFNDRDLDPDAVDYLIGSVNELRSHRPFELILHIAHEPQQALPQQEIISAIHNFFQFQVLLFNGRIRTLFARARFSLMIGLVVLFTCLTAAHLIRAIEGGLAHDIFAEGFVIIGWVAMWRPLELLLYEWWPILEQRRVHERLANCPIQIQYQNPPGAS